MTEISSDCKFDIEKEILIPSGWERAAHKKKKSSGSLKTERKRKQSDLVVS